jgi:hypothetical protein
MSSRVIQTRKQVAQREHRYIHCKKATERDKKAISTRIQTNIDAKRNPQEQIPLNSQVVSPSPPEQRR